MEGVSHWGAIRKHWKPGSASIPVPLLVTGLIGGSIFLPPAVKAVKAQRVPSKLHSRCVTLLLAQPEPN